MNTTREDDDLVTELNDDKARLLIPVIVYIAVLMISGILGNFMVCFYYGFKSRLTTNTFFIIVLAVYDLLACSVAMPTEIADIVLYYKFESGAACKIFSFVNYVSAMGSAFTLVVIALDRFNRIKQFRKSHMEIKHARIATIVIALLTCSLSWPAFLLYDAVFVEIPNNYGRTLIGQDCTSLDSESAKPYLLAFSIVHVATFLICSAALVVFYTVIGKTIFKHRRHITRYTCCEAETISSCKETYLHSVIDESEKHDQSNISKNAVENRMNTLSIRDASVAMDSDSGIDTKGSTLTKSSSMKAKIDTESLKITVLMLAVTALFIFSFLPAIGLMVWKGLGGETNNLSSTGLVLYKLGSRTYMLNSSLNAWIYGIFNSQFRHYFARKLLPCKYKK